MDRKQNKKEYKRSRSRSEKKRKKEKKRKNKDKKKKDKHSKKSDRRHSGSRSSSESSRSSRSNSPNQQGGTDDNKVKIIPLSFPTNGKQQQEITTPTSAQGSTTSSAIPSTILQIVNKAQQNVQAAVASNTNPLREKRNAFSSPPKNTGQSGFGAPVTAGGLDIPGLGGINLGSTGTSGFDIGIPGLGGLGGFGLPQDTQIIGNKIPPALQKQYIHALRVYIGNIPDPVDVEDVCKFVFEQMANAGGLLEPGNPIQSKKHDAVKKFIFLQLRSIEETSACMELDGIIYKGKSLRFRRPKDFGVLQKVEGTRPVPQLDKTKLKIVQTQVENTYNKLQIMNLPENFSEEHVMQLLLTYGDLKSFHLAVDKITSESKGFAFCEFITDRSTVECLNKLSGQQILNKVINVKRCNPQLAPQNEEPILSLDQLYKNLIENVNKTIIESGQKDIQEDYLKKMLSINAPKYDGLISEDATNILKLHNIVNKQLIEEDAEYHFIFNDLKTQLDRIGRTKQIIIPRKKDKFLEGIGFVFVEFDNERTSQIASFLLQKIKYDGKDVKAEFYSPQYFADRTFY
ncbi:hypothetical protein ABPG74_016451 [Tetrahymena malaccensis]